MNSKDFSLKQAVFDKAAKDVVNAIKALEQRAAELPNEIAALEKRHLIVMAELRDKEDKQRSEVENALAHAKRQDEAANARLADATKKQAELELLIAKTEKVANEQSATDQYHQKRKTELDAREDVLRAKTKAINELKASVVS